MKEGWFWIRKGRSPHYFVRGRSLCGRRFSIAVYASRTAVDNWGCKTCKKALEKRKKEGR